MVIRKVKKIDDIYEVLKPMRYNYNIIEGEWEKQGRKYNCKGLVSLLEGDQINEFILPKEVQLDVEEYQKDCIKSKRLHYQKDVEKYRKFRFKS